jgi:hypothetical protein
MDTITTADGQVITNGDRAFNFYDGRWGTVRNIAPSGWFDLRTDDGHMDYLNGERVCVVIPAGNPFHGMRDPKAPEVDDDAVDWLMAVRKHGIDVANKMFPEQAN